MFEPLASLRRRPRLFCPFPATYSTTELGAVGALAPVSDLGSPTPEVALRSLAPL
jgi:hypothetical protein